MSIISSRGYLHLKGIKESKHLTSDKEVLEISNEAIAKIYIPEVGPNAVPLTLNVKVGDEVKVGTVIGIRTDFNIPVYCSVSGKIIAEEMLFHAVAGRPVKHFVIENDFKDEKVKALEPLGEDASAEEIVEQIRKAGIVGLGGAGFPTYIKYRGVKDIDTVILNGVECEPFLTTDYKEMQEKRELLLKGATILGRISNAKEVIIAFKADKVDVMAKLNEIIADYPLVKIKTVKDAYPMGWERTLIKELTSREYDRLPSEAHVIVNNVQTTIEVARAVLYGEIMTHKVVTVSGDGVTKQSNVRVPIGTKVSSIVEFLGGYTDENVALLLGGPMTSKGQMNDGVVILPNCNGITILKHRAIKSLPCLRCGACVEHCPAGIQPVEIKIAVESKNIDRIASLNAMSCVECGLCSYICPSKIDVTEFVKKGKLQLRLQEQKKLAQQKAAEAKK